MSPAPDGATLSPPHLVRPYRASDRDTVRWLCCETGFLGQPIDPVFEDRELFADFLTNYYLKYEAKSAFVLEIDGEVRGYLLGCRHPLRNQVYNFFQNFRQFFSVLVRYPRYNPESRKFVHWILTNAWKEVPAAPRRTAHFHINLLPDARGLQRSAELIDRYLAYLRERGEKSVYGQMVSVGGRRGEKMFQRFGFKVLNRTEITKYRRLQSEPVYLSTVVKDLEERTQLYAEKNSL